MVDLNIIGQFPDNGGKFPTYSEPSLPSAEVNIPDMIKLAIDRIAENQFTLMEKLRQLQVDVPNFSLLEAFQNDQLSVMTLFDKISGAIRIDTDKNIPPGQFFRNPMHYNDVNGIIYSRGASYFIALDSNYPSTEDKLTRILRDLQELIDYFMDYSAPTNLGALAERLAIVDYLRNHVTTLFHVLTYSERLGDTFSESFEDYDHAKATLSAMVKLWNEIYLKLCLGLDFNIDVTNLSYSISEVMNLMYDNVESPETILLPKYFKLAEVDHPLRLVLNAFGNTEIFNGIGNIVAMPCGGTTPGIMTQALFSMRGHDIPLTMIPLSLHSSMKSNARGISEEDLIERLIREGVDFAGKEVLIVDDNSNSGRTIQRIYNVILKLGGLPRVSLVELDPVRVMIKYSLGYQDDCPSTVINLAHPDLRAAVGFVPITRRHSNNISADYQIRKLYAKNVINKYYAHQYEA